MRARFTIERPETLDEALDILAQGDETVRPVGGGTGLTLLMRYGFFEPSTLIDLRGLRSDLEGVEVTDDGNLRIGALTTLRDVEDAPDVAEQAPVLLGALRTLATVRLRNVAQVGGAVAHGHPQMDLPPVLIALDAKVHVRSRRGERWIPADELFRGYYETAIEDDELLTEVVLPLPGDRRGVYRKVTSRTVDDWPMLGLAVIGEMDGDFLRDVRISVGAVTDRALRLHDAEAALRGQPLTEELARTVAEQAADGLDVHNGPYGSAAYQRRILAVELRRALLSGVLDGDSRTGERQR